MRKIISQGSNTVMEGVFSSPFVAPSVKAREMRSGNRNRVRKARRLQYRKKSLAVLMILLASSPAFAVSPGHTAGQAGSVVQGSDNAVPAGRSEVLKPPRYGAQKSVKSSQAAAGRVYLDDYQKVPEAVTRKRSTATVWLGQKNKSR